MRDRALAAGVAAAVSLYSRLWLELESLLDQIDEDAAPCRDAGAGAGADRIELIRLELVVLLDHCGSPRWGTLLEPKLLTALRLDLTALLSALAAPSGEVEPERIIAAQNLLFDAVRNMHGAQLETQQGLDADATAARLATFAHNAPARKNYSPADAVPS